MAFAPPSPWVARSVLGGVVMAKTLLPDDLWALIEPLLPQANPRRFRYPGRKPIGNRQALTGILFVLKTGIPGEDLPVEMGCGWRTPTSPGDDRRRPCLRFGAAPRGVAPARYGAEVGQAADGAWQWFGSGPLGGGANYLLVAWLPQVALRDREDQRDEVRLLRSRLGPHLLPVLGDP